MGVVNFDKSLKYEVLAVSGTDFQVHSYRKDAQGEWQYLECFLTDMFGRVFEYEVWSDTLQEFIAVDISSKKSDYYKTHFKEIQDLLKIAIVEHECSKGLAL